MLFVTVAVKVTVWPNVEELSEEVSDHRNDTDAATCDSRIASGRRQRSTRGYGD